MTNNVRTAIQRFSVNEAITAIGQAWDPVVLASLNGQEVKVAKFSGEFVWHKHDDQDELFLVVDGHISLDIDDSTIELGPGSAAVVPKGVMHRPRAAADAFVLLFEPVGTFKTGNNAAAATEIEGHDVRIHV